MRFSNSVRYLSACAALIAAPALFGQQWEVGVSGGGSFYLNNSVTGRGNGEVGFKPGLAVGGWIGHNSLEHIGGEIRYTFQWNDMKVSNGSNSYNFSGHAHSVQYDVLIHTSARDNPVRPFFLVGGGLKGYWGTGIETAAQPLSNIALLTKTRQWQPMANVGAGVKWTIGPNTMLRVEIRDIITQVPGDVITASPGNAIKGWVHSFTPLFGIAYTF